MTCSVGILTGPASGRTTDAPKKAAQRNGSKEDQTGGCVIALGGKQKQDLPLENPNTASKGPSSSTILCMNSNPAATSSRMRGKSSSSYVSFAR
jgi:hypothetical protein